MMVRAPTCITFGKRNALFFGNLIIDADHRFHRDTNMPEQLVGGYALADAKSWATTLTTAIKSGEYKSQAAGWLDGMDVDDAEASALVWASDTNKYVCSVVLPDGVSAVESGDLSGTYYDDSIDTIKLQVAKGEFHFSPPPPSFSDDFVLPVWIRRGADLR